MARYHTSDEHGKRRRIRQPHKEKAGGRGTAEAGRGAGESAALAAGIARAARRLLKAVLDAQRINSHEARRRQIQYIGKVMRKVDPEPVRAALAAVDGQSAAARAQQRRLESWRERLIGDDQALTAFAGEHAGADLQALRTLIRNARKEIAEGKPPRAQGSCSGCCGSFPMIELSNP